MGKNSIIGKLRNAFKGNCIAIAMIALAAVGGLVITIYQFSTFYNAYHVSNVSQEAMRNSQIVAKAMVSAVAVDDAAQVQEYLDLVNSSLAQMQEDVAYMLEHHTGDKTPIDKYSEVMTGGIEIRKQIVELINSGRKDQAVDLYFASYHSILNQANEHLEELSASADQIAKNAYTRARMFACVVAIIVGVLSVYVIYMTLATSGKLMKNIQEPIDELKKGMDELAEGRLDFEITYESDDELGELAADFRKTCYFIRTVIKDANRLLEEMANGNFNISTECEEMYIGEFEGLVRSMRILNRTLNHTLADINEVSEQVASGSEQLASAAQAVAEGATEQAGAVEELQAVIINVLEHTHRAAHIAEDSYAKAKGYADNAKMAEEEMAHMIDVMNEINALSVQIGSIIENIEDIASQTNLLSLNASIEAARAGEAGRGFAVVAQQIGALADDSAKSALNTRELIENTIAKINTSNLAADKVAKSLGHVIEGITNLAELSNGSKETSMEQEQAMEQIEQGITNISEIVQSNSAASEESSAASQELSAHAIHLKSMLGQFRFRG